jgi:zinc and cadmium transporter
MPEMPKWQNNMTDLFIIILLALLGSVFALIGGIIFLVAGKWSKVLAKYSVPFASGVLLTVSFLGLLPEATHLVGDQSFTIVLIAFVGSYLFEMFAFDLHHHDDDHTHTHGHSHTHTHTSVPLVIVGDTIHNFIDGVAIAIAYLANPALGLITALSTFLLEVPHEIGDFGILLKSGLSKKKVFIINLLSSSTTVVGALLVFYLGFGTEVSGYLLAIAAGMFIYLGASDFLPKALQGIDKKKAIIMLLLGVAAMYMALSAVPHSHETHQDEAHAEIDFDHSDEAEHIGEESDDHQDEDKHSDEVTDDHDEEVGITE